MSLLNHLQFQVIDPTSEDIPEEHCPQDDISLDDQIDEDSLEEFWKRVSKDIHEDPDWFSFSDE
ncbi:MAG: hypothetical protein PWQ10_588 [Patescibacteria group bacterium]|nr:hypothetical protein [Patescibacteria group bacterium]